ncbi:MAG: diguanylate cyclase, partial [Spirochaetota bacterium]
GLASEMDTDDRRVAALNNLGELAAARGDVDGAAARYEQALDLATGLSMDHAVAVIRANVGRILIARGRAGEAIEVLTVALEEAVLQSDRVAEAEALTNLGRAIVADEPERAGEAEELHLRSIEICEELDHPAGIVAGLENLAGLLIDLMRLDEAELHLRRAMDLSHETNARFVGLELVDRLSQVYEASGMLDEALAIARWHLDLRREREGAETARRLGTLKAQHEISQARMEAEIVRLRNVELRAKSEQLEVSNRKLQLMHSIGAELTSTLELEEIARRLHDRLNELMSAEVFGIAFYREAERALDFALVIEDGQRLAPFVAPVDDARTLSGWVVRNRREICMNDTDRQYHQYVPQRTSFTAKRCRSIVFLPLELQGTTIGVLTVQSHRKAAYDPDTLDLLRMLSPYVAIAIENSRKLEENRALNRALEVEKQQLQQANDRIAHLANHDILTQLPNRRLLAELVHEYIPLARRQERRFGLVYVDLDDFKPVNDTFGHDAGDAVLVQVARRLSESVRESDTVARMGGDEFVVVVRDVGSMEDLLSIAGKLLAAVTEPIPVAAQLCQLSASMGVSLFPDHGQSYDDLIVAADRAMYRSKSGGKSAVAVAESDPYRSRISTADESIASPSKSNQPST